jgi:hypothetical protein
MISFHEIPSRKLIRRPITEPEDSFNDSGNLVVREGDESGKQAREHGGDVIPTAQPGTILENEKTLSRRW